MLLVFQKLLKKKTNPQQHKKAGGDLGMLLDNSCSVRVLQMLLPLSTLQCLNQLLFNCILF